MTARHRVLRSLVAAIVLLGAGVGASNAATTTKKRRFEVVSVDGNKVVYQGEEGVRELTLPEDFKLTMDDGKELSLADLKPGMKGTAIITTTTRSVPVTVTEVLDGDVMAVAGNTIIVRMNGEYKKFTQEDMNERGVTILREGEKVELHQLRAGDKLSAKVITEKAPKIVTEQDIKAVVDSASTPSDAAAASAPAGEGAPAADTPAGKTAGGLSNAAWIAIVILVLALVLFLLRRPRKG
jgi:hypothetical protein